MSVAAGVGTGGRETYSASRGDNDDSTTHATGLSLLGWGICKDIEILLLYTVPSSAAPMPALNAFLVLDTRFLASYCHYDAEVTDIIVLST